MVAVEEVAPEFEADTADGKRLKLSSLRGRPLVLYFYPEADTSGCTLEAKGFRDAYEAYKVKHVEVVGVSVDPVDKQCKFAEKFDLPFPLVADHTKNVAKLYGVLGPTGRAKRVSFLIDAQGKVVEVVEGGPEVHLAHARARFLAN